MIDPAMLPRIQQLPLQPPDIGGMRGPAELPQPFEWLPWALGGAVLLVAAAMLFFILRSRRKRLGKPTLAPGKAALRELDRAASADPESGFNDHFLTAVRHYADYRLQQPAFAMTSAELKNALKSAGGVTVTALELANCLEALDRARFARKNVDDDTRAHWIHLARQWIRECETAREAGK